MDYMHPVPALRVAAVLALVESHTPDVGTAQAVFAHLQARLALYMWVKQIELYELPQTISGKIRWVELRRLEVGRRANGKSRILEE